MKAITISEPNKIYIDNINFPPVKKNHAIIKVKSMGICGSDIAAYKGISPNVSYPLIIGHETTGIIHQIQDNDSNLQIGHRVVLEPYIFCGECYACQKGRTNCCEKMQVLGVQTAGSMCEYVSHPINLITKIPDYLDFNTATLIEPLSIALHAVHTVELKENEYFTIIGAGPIGILAGIIALSYGAIPIIIDISKPRLELAKQVGISHIINSSIQNPVEYIDKLTNKKMSDTLMEASGSPIAIKDMLNYVAFTGRIALTGWPKSDITLNTSLITKKEIQIRGSRNSVLEFDECIELLGSVPVNKIISDIIDFDKLPEMITHLSTNSDKHLKVIAEFKDYCSSD